jgi:hypothetical protein
VWLQDLLVASLFRNFLLAERIMAAANCTPVSYPRLPPTHQHPMWQVGHTNAASCAVALHVAFIFQPLEQGLQFQFNPVVLPSCALCIQCYSKHLPELSAARHDKM